MLALLAALLFPSPARAVTAGACTWLVPWDEAAPAEADGCFDELGPFVFAFDGRGRPKLVSEPALRRALSQKPAGARIVPVVVNDVQDPAVRRSSEKNVELLASLLNTDALVDRHVDALMSGVWSDDFDGLELDYERLPRPLYGQFAKLVDRLAVRLHAKGKKLAVDLEAGPLSKPDGRQLWASLARSADDLKVMMYYERGEFSDSVGPGTSLAWFRETARKAAAVVPPAKLTLVASLAATDWQVPYPRSPAARRVQRLHYGQALELMRRVGARPRWSEEWSAPFFTYRKGSQDHEVWLEDERSLGQKREAALAVGARFGVWYLGRSHPDFARAGLCGGTADPAAPSR